MAFVVSAFGVGLLFSATTTYYISNGLRERKLLCRQKYDEDNLKAYYYELVSHQNLYSNICCNDTPQFIQQLKEKVLKEKTGNPNPYYENARKAINENVVPNVQNVANKLFSLTLKDVKDLVESVTPKKE